MTDEDQIRAAYELGLADAALVCRRIAKSYVPKLLRERFLQRRHSLSSSR